MKKLLSIVLALLVALLPIMSLAEEAVVEEASKDWIFAAYDEGRKITTNVSFDTNIEDMLTLKDFSASFELQEDPGMFRVTINNAGTALDTITFAAMDKTLYVMDTLTGINVKFSEDELYSFLQNFIPTETEEIEEIVEEGAEEDAGFEEYVAYDDVDLDFTSLDLTPLLNVMIGLASCVNVVAVTETDNDDEVAESTEFPDEELENPDLGTNVIITLSADDATVLVNAICETIAKNSALDLFFGQYIDAFTTLQESFIDRMTQDMLIVIGLDDNGDPLYTATTFSLMGDDEVITSYTLETNHEFTDEAYTANAHAWALIGDAEDITELFTASCVITEANGTFELEVGTPKQDSFLLSLAFEASLEEAAQTGKVTVSADQYVDGAVTNMGVIAIDFAETLSETDAVCDVAITVTENEEQFVLNIDAATSDAETIEIPEDVANPAEMSEDELSDWLAGIALSFLGAFMTIEG